MADDKLAELLKTQKSLTEWLEDIKHTDVAMIRKEDNEKRERLRVLNGMIGLPYDKPTQFEAAELNDKNRKFQRFLQDRGNELCALRLMPKVDGLPKLRMRGKTIKDAYAWFQEQAIDADKYRADFVPHPPDYSWATIFIVNRHGIWGEIIFGGHYQLTQGFYDSSAPIVFHYDFKTWSIAPKNAAALAYLQRITKLLHVPSKSTQAKLSNKLSATFSGDYLNGYFETTDSSMGTWYIDYSPSLGKMYAEAIIRPSATVGSPDISGQTGSPGLATGMVAIVARELKIPCIVGTGNATKKLKNGQKVTVSADSGIVL